ncbi:hypothetical protein [Defluviimonas salinarum]|uniref:Uncharacterized protein n=1 Tax=Defluviimonas salinarum TaxID=2992147 RepID=A0ABT3J9E9_9RHOB|nr:hypothetical protein [Defluviimonas salinarum]MCW3784312.1 hypothetical protein [Defluviimonas salinarum]
MDTSGIRPKSEDGLKRLAKSIKREMGVTHTEALNLAAKQAGFGNFTNFLNRKGGRGSERIPAREILVTAHWRSRDAGVCGTIEARIRLDKLVTEITDARAFETCPRLMGFRIEAEDHVAGTFTWETRDHAILDVGRVARTLQFVEATGLQPHSISYPKDIRYGRAGRADYPGADHGLYWRDPETGGVLYMNEPYADGSPVPDNETRAWAARNGFRVERMGWGSLYWLNGGIACDLVSDRERGVDIDRVLDAMNASPAPFDEDEEVIEHEGIVHPVPASRNC